MFQIIVTQLLKNREQFVSILALENATRFSVPGKCPERHYLKKCSQQRNVARKKL